MPHPDKNPAIETVSVHAGRETDADSGAIAPPIHLSTTFERDADGGYSKGYQYVRDGNPNRLALERAMCALEQGEWSVAFASGTAATASVFQAAATRGRIVSSKAAYHGTLRQVAGMAGEGIARMVDTTDMEAVRVALEDDVSLLFVETPANPMMGISDLAALITMAREQGTAVACDNTFATPVFQNPLAIGADLVVHSSTKYLGGHSDLMGGVVVGRKDDAWGQSLRDIRSVGGAVPSPFDCWLLSRSLATLPVRVRTQSGSALLVAQFCAARPEIAAVLYPGLVDHPGHDIALRQMRGSGGMLSIRLRDGFEAAMAVAARVSLFKRATSLGGVESLIEHRASVEGPDTDTPDDLLRMSIGLEHPDDLIMDLAQALDSI